LAGLKGAPGNYIRCTFDFWRKCLRICLAWRNSNKRVSLSFKRRGSRSL